MEKTLLFRIAMRGGRAAAGMLKRVTGAVRGQRQQVEAAAKASGQIANYRRLKGELSALSQETKRGGSAAQAAKLQWRAKAEELRRVSQRLKQAGIDTRRLAAHEKELARQTAKANARAQAQAQVQAGRQMRQGVTGDIMGLAAPALMVAAPIKLAIDYESAMADVRKVVNFESPDGLQQMSRDILKLSANKIPIAAEGLAAIAAAGGQLGIAEKNLRGFVVMTSKMSVAFDMLPQEAGEASAKLSNVFGIPIPKVQLLGDAINHLSDNTAAKARDIVQAMTRIGGTSKQFGLSATQASALAASMIALGKPPEVAATGINALLTKLMTADKAGKKFQAALGELGLDAYELKDAIGEDAQGAIMKVLESIQGLDKSAQMGVLVDMFGTEYADDIATLVGSLDQYKKSLGLVGKQENYAGSMQKEFANRSSTTANQMQLLGNKLQRVAIVAGSIFLPAVNGMAGSLGWALDLVADLADAFPWLTTGVLGTVGGLLMAITVFKAGKMAAMFFGGGIKEIIGAVRALRNANLLSVAAQKLANLAMIKNQAITAATAAKQWIVMAATKAWTIAQWALNLAMNANPLGLIVAAVAALAAGAYLVIKNWDAIVGFFTDLWDQVTAIFRKAIDFITGWMPDWLKRKLGLKVEAKDATKATDKTKSQPTRPAKDVQKKIIEAAKTDPKAAKAEAEARIRALTDEAYSSGAKQLDAQGVVPAANHRAAQLQPMAGGGPITITIRQEVNAPGADAASLKTTLAEGRERLRREVEQIVNQMFARQQRQSMANVGA
jgi:TP901 family phage tail tape measure protein